MRLKRSAFRNTLYIKIEVGMRAPNRYITLTAHQFSRCLHMVQYTIYTFYTVRDRGSHPAKTWSTRSKRHCVANIDDDAFATATPSIYTAISRTEACQTSQTVSQSHNRVRSPVSVDSSVRQSNACFGLAHNSCAILAR